MEEKVSNAIAREMHYEPNVRSNTDHFKLQYQLMNHCWWINRHLGSKTRQILTGSAAEFYLHPVRSCIGDIDIMFYHNCYLVFDDDNPQLQGDIREFSAGIRCRKIVPEIEFPGYVQLLHIGHLLFDSKSNRYEFKKAEDSQSNFVHSTDPRIDHNSELLSLLRSSRTRADKLDGGINKLTTVDASLNGPAYKYKGQMKSDQVYCLRGLSWPNEANEWLCRERQIGGWPTKETIAEVVKQGCHFVRARHPLCQSHIYQWRYSFSKAEIILINSWKEIQQIVFHMLRYFAKRVLIKEGCPKEEKVLCTYHLKTLMLWSCEEQSPEWWESSNAIVICSYLLQKLSDWLQTRHCPNYFIRKANLLGDHLNSNAVQEIVDIIRGFVDSQFLALWFAKYYFDTELIVKDLLAKNYTSYVLRVTNMCTDLMKNQHDIFEEKYRIIYFLLIDCASKTTYLEDVVKFHTTDHDIGHGVDTSRQWHVHFTKKTLERSDPWLFPFAKLIYLLFLETLFPNPNSFHLYDMIKDVFINDELLMCNNFPASYPACLDSERVYLIQAEELMSGLNDCHSKTEFELLCRVSIDFFRITFRTGIVNTNVFCVASVYMAALHYAGGQHKSAVEFCSAALQINPSFQTSSSPHCDSKLNGQLLLYIDDAANAIGFLLLFRYVRQPSNQDNMRPLQNITSGLFFSPEVFANYLLISCKEPPVILQTSDRYSKKALKFQPDACLLALSRLKMSQHFRGRQSQSKFCVYSRDGLRPFQAAFAQCPPMYLGELAYMIMECCLEYITSFCGYVKTSFEIPCYMDKCYRALYMYKRRRYENAMMLCEQILADPEPDASMDKFCFMNVTILPPFLDYFDDDIKALIGMRILCWRILRQTCSAGGSNGNATVICTCTPTGSYYDLLYIDEFKDVHFVRSHFLANYLILRFKMDCGQTSSEILKQFQCLTARLPLEELIVNFMRRKYMYIEGRKTLMNLITIFDLWRRTYS